MLSHNNIEYYGIKKCIFGTLMKMLLDTHALIWFTTGSNKLPSTLVQQFADVANTLCVSRISLLEMAIKSQLAKADFPLVFSQWLDRFQKFDFEMLEITDTHLIALSQLPQVKDHRDPFDRLLIAQAVSENLTLVSCDGKFAAYPGLQLQWA